MLNINLPTGGKPNVTPSLNRCLTSPTIWTGTGLEHYWTRTGPEPDEDWTRTGPGLDQDWTRTETITGPGLDQDWTRTEPALDFDKN